MATAPSVTSPPTSASSAGLPHGPGPPLSNPPCEPTWSPPAWRTASASPPSRRTAHLVAFGHDIEAAAQDEARDVLDQIVAQLLDRVERLGDRELLRSLRDLDEAARLLRAATLVLLDAQYRDPEVRPTVFA